MMTNETMEKTESLYEKASQCMVDLANVFYSLYLVLSEGRMLLDEIHERREAKE